MHKTCRVGDRRAQPSNLVHPFDPYGLATRPNPALSDVVYLRDGDLTPVRNSIQKLGIESVGGLLQYCQISVRFLLDRIKQRRQRGGSGDGVGRDSIVSGDLLDVYFQAEPAKAAGNRSRRRQRRIA